MWTYRIFRDNQGRYSIREVFYNRDNTIVNYSKIPVAIVGASVEELMQLLEWFRDAFEFPILFLEDVDAQIVLPQKCDHSQNISLNQVIAELSSDPGSVKR